MKTTFVLLFKDGLKIKTYTSLRGIVEEFTKEDIGVSQSTLEKYDFSIDCYENNIVKIEKTVTKTPGEIRREKEQFL